MRTGSPPATVILKRYAPLDPAQSQNSLPASESELHTFNRSDSSARRF